MCVKRVAFSLIRRCVRPERGADLAIPGERFTKETLWELLYQDRLLVDYPDKNLSIWPREDWPLLRQIPAGGPRLRGRLLRACGELEEQARAYVVRMVP